MISRQHYTQKELALRGRMILPGCDCTLVGPGQYPRYTDSRKDGRPWVAHNFTSDYKPPTRLEHLHGSGARLLNTYRNGRYHDGESKYMQLFFFARVLISAYSFSRGGGTEFITDCRQSRGNGTERP